MARLPYCGNPTNAPRRAGTERGRESAGLQPPCNPEFLRFAKLVDRGGIEPPTS